MRPEQLLPWMNADLIALRFDVWRGSVHVTSRSAARSWRAAARTLLLLLGSVVVVLLALEATVRVWLMGPLGLDLRRVPLIKGRTLVDFVHVVEEPRLLFENIPDLDTFSGLVHFRTNSHGMRDRDYDQKIYIVPKIRQTLPIIGGVIAGSPVGWGLLLLQNLFKSSIDESVAFEYSMTGSWDDPQLTLLNEPPPEAPKEKKEYINLEK